MSESPLLIAAVSAVLSGGLVGAFVTLWTARQKVPAEVDSIAVSGAETAVLALERTLAAETKRADRAEAQVLKQDERIETLEKKLDDLQYALNGARAELQSLQNDSR